MSAKNKKVAKTTVVNTLLGVKKSKKRSVDNALVGKPWIEPVGVKPKKPGGGNWDEPVG